MKFTGERELKEGQNELTLKFESADIRWLEIDQDLHPDARQLRHQSQPPSGQHRHGCWHHPSCMFNWFAMATSRMASHLLFNIHWACGLHRRQKYQKVEFTDIEKGKADFEKTAPLGYVAMVQHYFASAWVLPANTARENFARKVDDNLYSVGMVTPFNEVAPGPNQSFRGHLVCRPARRKNVRGPHAGLRAGQRLRLADRLGQAFVLVT
jgi:YidC/Oxa1 family membrane protein insertase